MRTVLTWALWGGAVALFVTLLVQCLLTDLRAFRATKRDRDIERNIETLQKLDWRPWADNVGQWPMTSTHQERAHECRVPGCTSKAVGLSAGEGEWWWKEVHAPDAHPKLRELMGR